MSSKAHRPLCDFSLTGIPGRGNSLSSVHTKLDDPRAHAKPWTSLA